MFWFQLKCYLYIYEFWFTEEKKILENFEDHCVKIMGKRREEGYSEDEIIKDLCQATLQNFNSTNHIEDKEELGGSLGKRKRKTTAVMMESLDQANEQDATKKKKRNDNAGKENVNCSQAATPRQESKKGKGKRQQANAEKSTANNIGQLMFSSKYGNKFPSSLTRITQKDVVVSNLPPTPVVDPPVSTPSEMSICDQTNRLVPTSAAAYQAVPQLPANLAAPSAHQVASPQALDPAIIQAKPLALTNTTSQVLSSQSSCQGLRKPVAAVPSSQQVTPPDSTPQAVSLVSPKPPLPSTQHAVAPPASGLQATSPSAILTSQPIPTAKAVPQPVTPQQAIYPVVPNSQVTTETSISQTWATCDQALVLSGLREIVPNCSQQDEDILTIDDDLQPQLSPICQISPPSSFLNRTQEGDVQGIAAENEKLRAENASMKEELATLKKQLEMRPPGMYIRRAH